MRSCFFTLGLTCWLIFLLSACNRNNEADIIIHNGRIVDGSGNSWYRADIAVKDGKIVGIGNLSEWNAKERIDAQDKIVAPGFIDVHGHLENSLLTRSTADNYIYDGVTTVITGNCGGSTENVRRFFEQIDSVHTSINIATLIGHNTIR